MYSVIYIMDFAGEKLDNDSNLWQTLRLIERRYNGKEIYNIL